MGTKIPFFVHQKSIYFLISHCFYFLFMFFFIVGVFEVECTNLAALEF